MNPHLDQRHAGQVAIVMGGGPSLPEHLKSLDAAMRDDLSNAVWFSANEHGAMLRPVDYLVYREGRHQRESARAGMDVLMVDVLRPYCDRYGAMTVSHKPQADIVVDFPTPHPPLINAGMLAFYVAWRMGCAPIIGVAMDCYQNGTYHHDHGAKSSSVGKAASNFIAQARIVCDMAKGIRVFLVGDTPLREVWP